MDSDISSLQCKERCSDILAPPFEEFDHEAATTDDSELDPVLELFISSPSSPLASEAVGVLPLLPPPIISPDKEMVGGEKQSNEGELSNGGSVSACSLFYIKCDQVILQ